MVLIDGGLGQLHAAAQALEEIGISPRDHAVLLTAMTGAYTQSEIAVTQTVKATMLVSRPAVR